MSTSTRLETLQRKAAEAEHYVEMMRHAEQAACSRTRNAIDLCNAAHRELRAYLEEFGKVTP